MTYESDDVACISCGDSTWTADGIDLRGRIYCRECVEALGVQANAALSPVCGDPMEMAAWFMDRWERERGVVIGEGEGTDLTLLDDCLRDYGSHCAAEAVTASLFREQIGEQK